MNWPYAHTSPIWPMLVSAVWMGALALYSWRHRSAPGAIPLVAVTLLGALLAIVSAFELAALELSTKTDWFMVRTATGIPVGVAGVWFALQYAGLQRWATPGILGLLLVPLLPQVALYLVDPNHHLLWQRLWQDELVRVEPGPVTTVLSLYTVSLFLTSLAIMLALFMRSPLHRWPVGVMLLGLVAVVVIYALQTARLVVAPVNLTVLAADFAGLTFAIALVRFRFFSLVPIACETVFERAKDGIVVIDAEDRIADMNLTAEQILGTRRTDAIGKGFELALLRFPQLLQLQGPATAAEIEIEVDNASAAHIYHVSAAPLTGKDGFPYGRIMALQDITELKRTQQRLSQEQRELATLQERERVARELHDSLSQELCFINLQLQAARSLLATGKTAEADAYLSRLAEVAQEAHANVRWTISGLTAAIEPDKGLVGALSALVDEFQRRSGIQAEFTHPDVMRTAVLDSAVAIQLLRIVQEALVNVHRHACAKHVRVSLLPSAQGVEVVVEDDGCGFDRALLTQGEKTFGLGIMRQRAEEIGGVLEIISAPGRGTRITVALPQSAGQALGGKKNGSS